MEKVGEISRNTSNSTSKPRRLPEIPRDQEPYDVTRPPRKPPRHVPRPGQSLSPDLRRAKYRSHKRDNQSKQQEKRNDKLDREKSLSLPDLTRDFEDQDYRRHMNWQAGNSVPRSLKNVGYNSKSTASSGNQLLFTVPHYYGQDAVFTRRCNNCHQRVVIESGEDCLIAQSQLFHTTCLRCAICNNSLDVTDYCYITDHDKFYCVRHYCEVFKAQLQLENDGESWSGTGPGVFAVRIFANGNSERQKRTQMLKSMVTMQHRRAMLEKFGLKLQDKMSSAKRDGKWLLWKHWFDVTYEKTMIMRGVTELAYQVKESELCEEQEQLEKKLRNVKKLRDEEEKNEQEGKVLYSIFSVIEKRDLLLLELEIERRRDDAEVERLKSRRELPEKLSQADRSENISDNEPGKPHNLASRSQTAGDCLIL